MEKLKVSEIISRQQLITKKEARKLLGHKHKNLTDEQIDKLVADLAAIAKLYIRSVPKY